MNVTVKRQLALTFGALTIVVLGVSFNGLRTLSASNTQFAEYVAGSAKRSLLAEEVRVLTERRAIAVRDMVLVKSDEVAAEKANAVQAHQDLQSRLKTLREAVDSASDTTPEDRRLIAAIDKVEAAYSPVALSIVDLASSNRRDEAVAMIDGQCRPLLAALLDAGRDYVTYSKAQAELKVQAAQEAYAGQRNLMIGISALAMLLAAGMAWFITSRLIRALGGEPAELSEAARRVAEGDLSPVAHAHSAPPGSVLASMGTMQGQLVDLIGHVRSSADSIATASAQIAQGNNDLSSRTEQQASALEETAASMEELSSTVKHNADNARQGNQLAQSASEVAVRGGEVVSEVVETMKGINDSSRRIADIINVIDGIAFQTNILALNAAVEAARAGEQGRGFAVVASEVRNLAGRSAEAAKEIKSLIMTSVQRVDQGTSLVDQAGATMSEVVSSIKRVNDIMGEISAASTEQSAGVSQVGEAVTQMDQATQQNAALVEESAAAAESLKLQAEQLVDAVAVFRTPQAASSAVPRPAPRPASAERQHADRAVNVTRLRQPVLPIASERSEPFSPGKGKGTGTDDWQPF